MYYTLLTSVLNLLVCHHTALLDVNLSIAVWRNSVFCVAPHRRLQRGWLHPLWPASWGRGGHQGSELSEATRCHWAHYSQVCEQPESEDQPGAAVSALSVAQSKVSRTPRTAGTTLQVKGAHQNKANWLEPSLINTASDIESAFKLCHSSVMKIFCVRDQQDSGQNNSSPYSHLKLCCVPPVADEGFLHSWYRDNFNTWKRDEQYCGG